MPYLVWGGVSFVVWLVAYDNKFEGVVSTIVGIVNHKYLSIYWFFIPLFSIYLSIPVLAKLTDRIWSFRYMVVYGILSFFVLPFVCSLLHLQIDWQILSPLTGGGYIVYSLIGWLISEVKMTKKVVKIVYVLGIVGFLSQYFGTIFLSIPGGEINGYFKGYINWPCLFQSVATFCLFKQIFNNDLKINAGIISFVRKLQSLSLGCYLIHFYFIKFAFDYLGVKAASMTFRTLGAIFIFSVSCLIVFVIRKTKIGRILLP